MVWKSFTIMQKVLTLQFSCTGIGDTVVGTLVKAWLDDHQKELQCMERERGALEPPALHFDDLQF